MVNEPPDYCPRCGGQLVGVDEPTSQRCTDCGEYVFYNPTPSARIAVLDSGGGSRQGSAAEPRDGDAMLLVTRPDGRWILPGGKVEVGADPDEHAAVELKEETNLTVDPEDLWLYDLSTYVVFDQRHCVGMEFAVDAASTSGTIEAGDDAGRARFWTPEQLAASDEPSMTADELRERLRLARRALAGEQLV
ncbi:NUDIX domain-containing protein [Halosimplex halophilum]|uniref:NUDIX domain-containing protein n=1 Tax=Halosimplex halophilum TaxID=2559572 RepID=UPI00107F68EF|nr:NUDIX domain-containing protein [Halosimplex halophilum]